MSEQKETTMREIKFRIWDGDRYVSEGWYIGNKIYSMRNCQSADPNEEVLEQFTGLRDKNGREIYEGDIVAFNVKADNLSPQKNNLKGAVTIEPYGVGYGTWSAEWCKDVYILGNIHEDQELLND